MSKIQSFKDEILKGYTFKGDSIVLGAAKLDGEVVEGTQIKIPLKTISSAIAGIAAIHEAQLMSYLRLSGCRYGLLINFNVKLLREGLRRFKI